MTMGRADDMVQLTFLDICSGIGGFRLGLEAVGHKCIGYCEYDKFARASYEAMYDTEGEWYADDVTELKSGEVPYADIWTFGFPCQDISIAGKQRGLSGKRSGIYFSIIDLIKGKEESDKPTYLLVENVKNLLSVNGGFDFAAVLSEMDEAGYDVRWQVLNSKDHGVPQNRERVFLIANLRSRGGREILPVSGEDGGTLKEVIGGMQGYRVYDPSGISVSISANGGGIGAKTGLYCVGNVNPSGKGMNGKVYDARGLAPAVTTNKGQGNKVFVDQMLNNQKITEIARCLVANYRGGFISRKASNSGVLEAQAVLTPNRIEKRQNGRRMKEPGEPMFTLTAQDQHGVCLWEEEMAGEIPEGAGLPVRNATKLGYEIANPGDGVVLAYPNSDTRRGRVGKGCSQALDTGCQMGTVMKCGRIRRLTPRECFRLQGFPDELYERAASVSSETQLYKQAGNAVTATVTYAVAMSLPESREEKMAGTGDVGSPKRTDGLEGI